MQDLFDRLNKETREYNARKVDRFNTSTKGNYNYFDTCRLNNETFKQNNGQYSNFYNFYNK
jgi:hypothetical protein